MYEEQNIGVAVLQFCVEFNQSFYFFNDVFDEEKCKESIVLFCDGEISMETLDEISLKKLSTLTEYEITNTLKIKLSYHAISELMQMSRLWYHQKYLSSISNLELHELLLNNRRKKYEGDEDIA